MTFKAYSADEYRGTQQELFLFTTKERNYWYTNGDAEFEYNGDVYTPAPLGKPAIVNSGDIEKSGISFRMKLSDTFGRPLDLPRLNIARAYPSRVGLALYRTNRADPDGEVVPMWNGLVKTVPIIKGEAEFECETLLTAMRRYGLTDKWQHLCNAFLYKEHGGRCPVSMASHRRPATVTAISGRTITVSGVGAFEDHWFKAGFLVTENGDTRDVLASVQSSGLITLTAGLPSTSLRVGSAVDLYDGCDHVYSTCHGPKFAAETEDGDAFRAAPYTPLSNAFKTGVQAR